MFAFAAIKLDFWSLALASFADARLSFINRAKTVSLFAIFGHKNDREGSQAETETLTKVKRDFQNKTPWLRSVWYSAVVATL